MPNTGIRRSAMSRISRRSNSFAAIGQRADRRVQHPAVAARIEVRPADQHDAVDLLQELLQVVVVCPAAE